MERILLLDRLKALYLKQRDHTEVEQWDSWDKTALEVEELHEALSEVNDKDFSHTEKQLVNDIVKLYTMIKTELENKLKQTCDELDDVNKKLEKLRDSRIKLLEQRMALDTMYDTGGAVLNVKC